MSVIDHIMLTTLPLTDHAFLPAADQTRMMQDQMSGAAMAMSPDPSKAFKVELATESVFQWS